MDPQGLEDYNILPKKELQRSPWVWTLRGWRITIYYPKRNYNGALGYGPLGVGGLQYTTQKGTTTEPLGEKKKGGSSKPRRRGSSPAGSSGTRGRSRRRRA